MKILKALGAAALLMGALGLASAAKADSLQISCTGVTTCAAGGIQTTGSTNPTFNLIDANKKYAGTLYVAIIVPEAEAISSFTVNGGSPTAEGLWTGSPKTIGDFVGLSDNQHNYSSTQSFSASSGGYDIFLANLGAFKGPTGVSFSFLSGAFPKGTLFVGFDTVTNKKGVTTVLTTPWSESLATTGTPFTPTPEPGSMLLLGTGLLAVGGMVRRKFSA